MKQKVLSIIFLTAALLAWGTAGFGAERQQLFSFGTISGTCFNDVDQNGILDDTEPGISGVTVTLKKISILGFSMLDMGSADSSADGTYSFTDLPIGLYLLEASDPEGAQSTTSNKQLVFVGFIFRSPIVDFGDYLSSATDVPAVSISADKISIESGESVTLSWTSQNADTVSIDNGIGEVDASGELEVSPAATTTYTITASKIGASGTQTATDSVTVSVILPPPAQERPSIQITTEPGQIIEGEKAVISWISQNATSVTINNGIGQVAANGSIDVFPDTTTTYIFTLFGPGGLSTASTTVTVLSTATGGGSNPGGGTTTTIPPSDPVVQIVITMPSSGTSVTDCNSIIELAAYSRYESGTTGTSDPIVWASNRDGELGTGSNLSVSALTYGEHTITASYGSVSSEITLNIGCNTTSSTTVTQPPSGSTYKGGDTIPFQVPGGSSPSINGLFKVIDPLPASPVWVWISSIDSVIGFDNFDADDLSCGAHTIYLLPVSLVFPNYPNDVDFNILPGDLTGIPLNAYPRLDIFVCDEEAEVLINSPVPGSEYTGCADTITFNTSAGLGGSDVTDDYDYVWESSVDGVLTVPASGQDDNFTLPAGELSNGYHTITLTAYDGDTVVREVTTSILVACDKKPVLIILQPDSGTPYNCGDTLELVAAATDYSGGTANLSAITWSSSVDGDLGSGSPLSIAVEDLTFGYHVITATVGDTAEGTTAKAVISINNNCSKPDLIELVSFEALLSGDSITVSWETASEIDTAGFNLYRASDASGDYQKINNMLIPAEGSATTGSVYSFTDGIVSTGTTYVYLLEDIDVVGTPTFHGPIEVDF